MYYKIRPRCGCTLDPDEGRPERHCCAYCGEEIEAGWEQYTDFKDYVHAECFKEWVFDTFYAGDIADGLGFLKVIAT